MEFDPDFVSLTTWGGDWSGWAVAVPLSAPAKRSLTFRLIPADIGLWMRVDPDVCLFSPETGPMDGV